MAFFVNETKLFVIFAQSQRTVPMKPYLDGMDPSSMTLHLHIHIRTHMFLVTPFIN